MTRQKQAQNLFPIFSVKNTKISTESLSMKKEAAD